MADNEVVTNSQDSQMSSESDMPTNETSTHPAITNSATPLEDVATNGAAIPTTFVQQPCSEWCWAAVASMITTIPGARTIFMSPCTVAGYVFAGEYPNATAAEVSTFTAPCCAGTTAQNVPCNVPQQMTYVAQFLRYSGQYQTTLDTNDYIRLTPENVFNSINAAGGSAMRIPVAFLISFPTEAHVVLAIGISGTDTSAVVTIFDPMQQTGPTYKIYDDLVSNGPVNLMAQWACFFTEN